MESCSKTSLTRWSSWFCAIKRALASSTSRRLSSSSFCFSRRREDISLKARVSTPISSLAVAPGITTSVSPVAMRSAPSESARIGRTIERAIW